LSQSLGMVDANNPAAWARRTEAELSIKAIAISLKLTPPNTSGSNNQGTIVRKRETERSM